MGLIRWLARRALVPGEPAVSRSRKLLVAPAYCIVGSMAALWAFLAVLAAARPSGSSAVQVGSVCRAVAYVVMAAALVPAGAYVVLTRRVSRRVCEYPAVAAAFAVIALDAADLLEGDSSSVAFNVLVLDTLLLCSASEASTRVVVCSTAVWITARACLEFENVAGAECFDGPPRYSFTYFRRIVGRMLEMLLVLLVDFGFTRSFAKSMHHQRSMVEASIQLSEAAAVLLSKYETEDTKTLLDGPDGERLPAGLREALLQLVTNLALYRPYLPQSCLPGDTSVDMLGLHDADSSVQILTASQSLCSSAVNCSTLASEDLRTYSCVARGLVQAETKCRNVSLVAVNTTSSLRGMQDVTAARLFIAGETDVFVGKVAAERGVVDLVSGDHMFGNFNASRMCTTHRVSAARVAWSMVEGCTLESAAGRGPSKRTGCACSGLLLCGDLGTADFRRFMLLGAAFNTTQCLERVAARLGTVLADESVGADADVRSSFFSVLLERLCYAKRGPKPFLVWQLATRREVNAGGASEEWMYELERLAPSPYQSWNDGLHEWLNFGVPLAEAELGKAPFPVSAAVTRARQQSRLVEATVSGGTVAIGALSPDPGSECEGSPV